MNTDKLAAIKNEIQVRGLIGDLHTAVCRVNATISRMTIWRALTTLDSTPRRDLVRAKAVEVLSKAGVVVNENGQVEEMQPYPSA